MTVCQLCPRILRSDNVSGLCRACWPIEFREEHRQQIREKGKLYRRAEPARLLLSNAKQRARRMGLDFDITEQDITIPERCPYLGITLRSNDGTAQADSPSLDRISANRGYVRGNTQVISHLANRAKTNLSAGQLDLFAMNHLRMRGIRVIDEVEGIPCPACAADGPHERVGAAQDGSYVLARCHQDGCGLEWKVS